MEFVYVVPREELFPEAFPHGFVPLTDDARTRFEDALETGFFVERERAERTLAWKQIIPYTLVVRPDGDDLGVLLLRRLTGGGEARLHDKLSIGVGGHINPEDLDASRTAKARRRCTGLLEAGSRRELAEELLLEGDVTLQRVGLINDDSHPVGAVHAGLVQVATVEGPVSIREVDALEGRLVSTRELHRLLAAGASFETWSSLLVPQLDDLLPRTSHVPT